MSHQQRRPDPTPEEIRQMMSEIKAAWSEEVANKRLGIRAPIPYVIPIIKGDTDTLGWYDAAIRSPVPIV